MPSSPPPTSSKEVDILILGAGWTSTFLLPLLVSRNISHVATSTSGREGTLPFKFTFDTESKTLDSQSLTQLKALPHAKTVVIVFPLVGEGQSRALVEVYEASHSQSPNSTRKSTGFIQLGSSGIFSIIDKDSCWITRHSKYDSKNTRAIAEDELLTLGGCVLNLSGLWGGERQVKHWLGRVATSKEQLKGKGSLHMIHGLDVARGIVGVHERFNKARGERWVRCQYCFVYLPHPSSYQ